LTDSYEKLPVDDGSGPEQEETVRSEEFMARAGASPNSSAGSLPRARFGDFIPLPDRRGPQSSDCCYLVFRNLHGANSKNPLTAAE
jgi:hypothetical protein